jgi:hypothetical protein
MFAETIVDLNKGATIGELNGKLAEVVAAVRATAKAGSLTVKLDITPGSKGNAEMVFVKAKVSVKCPTEEPGSTLFFTTEDNRLTRYNERQRDLPFEGELRVIEFSGNDPVREAV